MQILIVDLGSQYTMLIGRTLRDFGVRSIVLSPRKAERWIEENRRGLKGIIISGGAASIDGMDPGDLAPSILAMDRPILGICLGMHWMARGYGGAVESPQGQRGYGAEEIEALARDNPLFRRIAHTESTVWMSHGDSVTKLPPRFHRIAQSAQCPIAAMASDDLRIFGVQFHPEVTQTEFGKEMLSGFLDICGIKRDWEPSNIIQQIREDVADAVGPTEHCLLAFSGGVDSSTLAAILAPVLGRRMMCVTLDHGGLRKGELQEITENALAAGCSNADGVWNTFAPWFQFFPRHEAYLERVAAAGIDAEAKRRAFRAQYTIDIDELARESHSDVFIQGTLAPDIIESGAIGAASHIVTHHNVGMDTELRQLHPLADLFKYEIRDLARHLKLPPSISERKPFPGPGLYCRVVGAPVTQELLETVRWADAEVRRIVAEAKLEGEFDQLVVVLLPGSPVAGIKGDGRAYGLLAAVRAVQTSDFMTCRGYQFPPRADNPDPIRKRIEKALVKHPQIVGVVFDETDKPPRRTEFE